MHAACRMPSTGQIRPRPACRWPWLIRTDIPPLLQYPVGDAAFPFVCGLIAMFYGPGLRARLDGLVSVARCFLFPPAARAKKDS